MMIGASAFLGRINSLHTYIFWTGGFLHCQVGRIGQWWLGAGKGGHNLPTLYLCLLPSHLHTFHQGTGRDCGLYFEACHWTSSMLPRRTSQVRPLSWQFLRFPCRLHAYCCPIQGGCAPCSHKILYLSVICYFNSCRFLHFIDWNLRWATTLSLRFRYSEMNIREKPKKNVSIIATSSYDTFLLYPS